MSDPKTVYAISEGSYSDYRVKALFPTRKLAEEANRRYKASDPSWYHDSGVEEFYLWEEVPELVTVWKLFQELWDDGTEEPAESYSDTGMPWDYMVESWPRLRRPEVRFIRVPVHHGKGGRLEVRARTEAALLKAYHDRYAQWKAETA